MNNWTKPFLCNYCSKEFSGVAHKQHVEDGCKLKTSYAIRLENEISAKDAQYLEIKKELSHLRSDGVALILNKLKAELEAGKVKAEKLVVALGKIEFSDSSKEQRDIATEALANWRKP